MTDTTMFFIDLFLLLAAAVLAGEGARRLGQAALVGQLLVGVILGPTLFGPFDGLSSLGPQLGALQFLATVFILFMAGLDVVPGQIYRMGVSTLLMGVAIFAIPFAVISVVARILYPGTAPLFPLFLGLTLSITALPVMGIMLIEFGLVKTRLGNLLINTALVNELTAVTVFAVLLQFQNGPANGVENVAVAALSVAVFLSAMLSVHMLLRAVRTSVRGSALSRRVSEGLRTREAGFAILMVGVIGASLFSQFMGLTFVVGAFYAGILVTKESAGVEAHKSVSGIMDAMTWGFFIPLFFAFVGLQMNLRVLNSPWLVLTFAVLLAAAVLSKVGTGYSVARFFGWPRSDAMAIANLVSSRGAVELAMAVILLQDGVFGTELFTLVAGVGLATTIIAPIGARAAWDSSESGKAEMEARITKMRALRAERPGGYEPTLSFAIVDEDSFGTSGGGTDVRPEAAPRARPPAAPGPPPLPERRK